MAVLLRCQLLVEVLKPTLKESNSFEFFIAAAGITLNSPGSENPPEIDAFSLEERVTFGPN